MELNLVQVGDPILRTIARLVTDDELHSSEFQDLIQSMRAEMHHTIGIGIAAPQVGVPMQLVLLEDVYAAKLTPERQAAIERYPLPLQVVANPTLEVTDSEKVFGFEGCLSIDGHLPAGDRYRALVPRFRGVRVKGLNERGEPVSIDARGWHARILQHEIDHLNGILFINRMVPQSLTTVRNIDRFWKDMPVSQILASIGVGPLHDVVVA